MKNMQVGVRVARQVRTAEHAIDQAMIEVCRLVQTSLEGRVESRLAAEVGQAAIEHIIAGLGQLATVRASVEGSLERLGLDLSLIHISEPTRPY